MNNKPFLMKPATKDYLWGGRRLCDDFGKETDVFPLAETWECSVHHDGQSVEVETGMPLGDILKEHPEYLGTHAASVGDGTLPIMIKLIDAKSDLSVQVHPSDNYARRVESDNGKTEMWFVVDAKPETRLVYGFNRDMEAEQVKQAASDGTIEKLLNKVDVHKGDMFFIEPGIVHAIGAGALIAEIQQSSNVTYRMYDYNRVDKNGKKRELHIDKALDVAKLTSSNAPRQPMRVFRYRNGCAIELLSQCKYFKVERMVLNTELQRNLAKYKTDSNSFHALLCLNGCGSISGENYMMNFFKGDCIFVPAESITLKLHGKAELLDVSC